MSAGAPVVDHDLSKLAPLFRKAVVSALAECHDQGYDAVVHEAFRSAELHELYWHRGRPPTPEWPSPVTFARTNEYTWHGFGLAVDVISKSRGWFHPLPLANPDAAALGAERQRARLEGNRWFHLIAEIFKRHQCRWGGDWKKADPPHFQWALCKPSPSDRARELLRTSGLESVWKAVGAGS